MNNELVGKYVVATTNNRVICKVIRFYKPNTYALDNGDLIYADTLNSKQKYGYDYRICTEEDLLINDVLIKKDIIKEYANELTRLQEVIDEIDKNTCISFYTDTDKLHDDIEDILKDVSETLSKIKKGEELL